MWLGCGDIDAPSKGSDIQFSPRGTLHRNLVRSARQA
jgi:hypothetical protein